jgi:hypothetical protein
MMKCVNGGVGWPTETRDGWLPVGISSPHCTVRWIEFGARPLLEPFFEWSISALRGQRPPANEFETEVQTLIRDEDSFEALQPAGFILHMTRCGSTLVRNAIGVADGVLVLSEAQPVGRSLELIAARSERVSRMGKAIAKCVVSVFARYGGGDASKLVLKCDIGGMISLNAIRSVWPHVPCLIIVRHPAEVVISNINKPARWLSRYDGRSDCGLFGRPPREVHSQQEFCAWVIGRLCAEALVSLDENCLVVDYEHLNPGVVRVIARHLGLQYSPASNKRLESVFRVHAKDSSRTFVSDVNRKRSSVTDSLRMSVERWALNEYMSLRGRALGTDL